MRLSETFGAPASWNWTRPDGSFGFEAVGIASSWPSVEALVEWQREVRATHPLLRWYAATGDPAALTIERVPSTVSPVRDFQEVRDFYVRLELEQQLSIPLVVRGEHHLAFVLARPGEDFSDEDLLLARQIQPLLRLVHRQACVLGDRQRPPLRADDLTGRELAVVRLLAEGLTAMAIGHRLGISERTIHKHLEHAYRKLGAHDRLSAVAAASRAGLVGHGRVPARPTDSKHGLRTFAFRSVG